MAKAKKKFKVHLARLLRETVCVIVEAESEDDIDVGDVYDDYDDEDWEPDFDWVEAGEHYVGEVEDGEEETK